jgi:hypothetical protein
VAALLALAPAAANVGAAQLQGVGETALLYAR